MLRRATVADVDGMHAVRMAVRENVLVSTVLTPDDYRRAIEPPGRAWVVESEGRIVAFACGNAETGNVWALFVAPSHEQRGHGTRLLEDTVAWLRSQGVDRPWLTTAPGTRAARFYERRGWTLAGTTASHESRYELDQ